MAGQTAAGRYCHLVAAIGADLCHQPRQRDPVSGADGAHRWSARARSDIRRPLRWAHRHDAQPSTHSGPAAIAADHRGTQPQSQRQAGPTTRLRLCPRGTSRRPWRTTAV